MYFLSLVVFVGGVTFLGGHHPVHGVLTLVVVGLGLSGYLWSVGLEFAGLVVTLVYVGAVAVLFVFVVMMVNLRAVPVGFATVEVRWAAAVAAAALVPAVPSTPVGSPAVGTTGGTNLSEVGTLLYGTERLVAVGTLGVALFVAMVAAIALSLVAAENYRTQNLYTQIRKEARVFGFTR